MKKTILSIATLVALFGLSLFVVRNTEHVLVNAALYFVTNLVLVIATAGLTTKLSQMKKANAIFISGVVFVVLGVAGFVAMMPVSQIHPIISVLIGGQSLSVVIDGIRLLQRANVVKRREA